MRPLCVLAIACCLPGLPLPAAENPPSAPTKGQPPPHAAKERLEHEDGAHAEEIYRKRLEAKPDDVHLLSRLGVAFVRQGKYREAETAFKKAVTLAPDDAFCHCTLGTVYYAEGKYDNAVESLSKAVKLDPKSATAHNFLGITMSHKGQQDLAQQELEKAVNLDSTYVDAIFNLAVVLATKSPPDKVNARKRYDRAIELGATPDPAMDKLLERSAPERRSKPPALRPPPGRTVVS